MRWTKKPFLIMAVAVAVVALPAAAFAASGSQPHSSSQGGVHACWLAREHAVAQVLGTSLKTLRQDHRAKETISQLVAAKGMTMTQFKAAVAAALAKDSPLCLPPLAHKGQISAFIRLAAGALGMAPATLLHDVFSSGINGVLAAHHMTSQQLLAAMASRLVAAAQSHGHTLNLANVTSRLTTFYDHLAGITPATSGASAG